MATVGTLTVDLIAQTASFNANIEKAAANLNNNASRMNRSIAGIQHGFDKAAAAARGLSLLAAGGALVGLAKQSLDFASAIGETAQQVGVTAKELQVYRYAATQAGLTQEEMEAGLRKLTVSLGQASLGAKAQGEAFAALGISVRDSTGHVKTAGQVLPEIANSLERIKDPAQRAAAEVALFGRAGQKLDPILSQGADNIDAYAKRAEELGLVLSDELVGAADEAADRMAELTTQMKVSFAGVVAENANSILALANALGQLTGQAINFIAQYPRLTGALAGAAVGSRVGGLYGAVAGSAGGFLLGDKIGRDAADSNMDPKFRAAQLRRAIANFKKEREIRERDSKGGGPLFRVRSGTGYDAAYKELQKQMGLTDASIAARNNGGAPALPPVDLPAFLGGGGGKSGGGRKGRSGPSPEELAEREARRLQSFYDDLARTDADLLSAKMENTADSDQLAALSRQQLTIEMDRTDEAIKAAVVAGDLKQSEADQLLEKTKQLRAEKLLTINTDALEASARDRLDITMAANDNERDILQGLESLATTQAERRKIALDLLDLEEQEERIRLQQIIDLAKIGRATAAEARIAEDRLKALPQIYGDRRTSAKNATAGPMEVYLKDLNDIGKVQEALEQIRVDGLTALGDGIADVITGVKSLGDAFRDVASQIIADLIRIAVQQMIVKPLANALFGGGSLPGFANGTNNAPSGFAWVGENGPEIVRFRGGEQVIPNHRLPQMRSPGFRTANDNAANVTIQMQASGNPRADRESATQAAYAVRRVLNGARG